jgi:hypothetical protein
MTTLKRRLRRLEQNSSSRSGLSVVKIIGGLHDADPYAFAKAGASRWKRDDSEIAADFRERALSEARAASEQFLIFGGLPDDPLELDAFEIRSQP